MAVFKDRGYGSADIKKVDYANRKRNTFFFRYDIQEEPTQEGHDLLYSFAYSLLNGAEISYGNVVSDIIESRYPQSVMDATINNYLSDPTGEHLEEWNAMQEWRNKAKEEAKELLQEYRKLIGE